MWLNSSVARDVRTLFEAYHQQARKKRRQTLISEHFLAGGPWRVENPSLVRAVNSAYLELMAWGALLMSTYCTVSLER